MPSSEEKLRIFENALSIEGMGGDVIGRYTKSLAMINGMQTYNEMNPPPVSPTAANLGNTEQSLAGGMQEEGLPSTNEPPIVP